MTKTDLAITSRGYQGADDLIHLQHTLAGWIQETGGCGYEHVGDITHRFYNGLRGQYPRSEMIRVWQSGTEIVGFANINPRMGLFDARISPEHRGSSLEFEVLRWATDTIRDWMDREGAQETTVKTDFHTCDTPRRECLVELGYQPGEKPWMITNERALGDDLPDVILPDGFSLRSVTDADAAAVAAVHKSAFNAAFTPEIYLNEVMRQPGYDPNLEHVVVAPDGTFAAFCITWLDSVNKIGLFEPVGTHQNYQRRGLGRAVMTHGLHVMRQRGMEFAQVGNSPENPASEGLYRAMGFTPKYESILCHKPRN